MIHRFRLLPLIAGLALATACFASLPAGYDRIFTSADASESLVETAHDLADLLEREYGERPVVRREPFLFSPRGIHIGPAPEHGEFDGNPLTDEILIARSGRGLVIHGSDNTATRFAVYRFLEEFLSWRCFAPGPLGLEKLDIPTPPPPATGPSKVLLYERAAYHSRNPSVGRARGSPDWAIWNGLRERFHYNHMLHKAIPPLVFDDHPDWFAKDARGNPQRPPYYPDIHGYNDHPDLSVKDLRKRVSDLVMDSLERQTPFSEDGVPLDAGPAIPPPVRHSPGVLSTSLSLGDSFVFGEFPDTYPWNPGGYFRRWPDWSNHVFAYTNAVAREVTRRWEKGKWLSGNRPELYLGALAYLNWENVPDFPLHPRIVPYLTFDRTQWHDPQARRDDLANVENWNRAGSPFLGTWDYLFGYGFLIPRSLVGIVSESIPRLHELGVRGYFSQMAPVWPYDAHTNWLLARLLWDPARDPEALLDEFHAEYFGPAAATMRTFFKEAEKLWMNQSGPGWWLRYWKDPWQAALWSGDDIKRLDDLLQRALTESRGPGGGDEPDFLDPARFSLRVEAVDGVFDVTQALHRYQRLCWNLQTTLPAQENAADPGSVLDLARAALDARDRLEAARDKAVAESDYNGYLSDLSWVFRYDNLGGVIAAHGQEWRLGGEGQRFLRRAEGLLKRWADKLDLEAFPRLTTTTGEILHDNDFSETPDPRIWHRQFMDSRKARHGTVPGGYEAENVRRGHLYQLFKALPGEFYLGMIDVDTGQSPSGEVYIRVDFFDSDNELIARSPRSRIAPTGQYGSRQRLNALMRAPPGTAYGRLFIRFYEMDYPSRAVVERARVFPLRPARNP